MANTKSAEKRARTSLKRNLRNRMVKSRVRTFVRSFTQEQTPETLRAAISEIDRAVIKGVMHRNTAARKKSRLTRRLNALTQAK
jgi:small subunit ribosomal protein S20